MVNMAIMAPPIMPAMAPAIRKPRNRLWFLVVSRQILLLEFTPSALKGFRFVELSAQRT
jgi:hypothetical protein